MTTDEAIATIPNGWRLYTCDASIVGRWSVMLRQTHHMGYVSVIGPTLVDAIQTAAIKAKWHWRGWSIEPTYAGYEATHPDYDYDPETGDNGLYVHGMTVEDVKAQIDCVESER